MLNLTRKTAAILLPYCTLQGRKKKIYTFFELVLIAIIYYFKSCLDYPQKLKVETSKSFTKEDISSITTQAPENLSDGEEESKFCEKMKLKIEGMKTESCKLKGSLPILTNNEPLSSNRKLLSKFAQMPFRNLIFNPNCSKELFKEHFKKVYKSVVYGVHYLKKPNETTKNSGFVLLSPQSGTNLSVFFRILSFLGKISLIL